jgi:hypothetical protein
MEYFIGSVATIIAYVIFNRAMSKESADSVSIPVVRYSQSHIYSLLKPYLEYAPEPAKQVNTQSLNYYKKIYVRILVSNNKAYWIKNNVFYTAEFKEGMVDKDTTKEVDTMSMTKTELDQMMFIVEKLQEGSNDDNWNPGKSYL